MTVSNIDCDYDGQVTSAAAVNDTGTGCGWGLNGVDIRAFIRFPLSVTIMAGSTINDVDFQGNVNFSQMEGTETTLIRPYNTTGDDDPQPDSGANKYTRAANGSNLISTTVFDTTGSKTVDLGTTADGQVQGNISSPGIYSLGLSGGGLSGVDTTQIEAIENAGTDPATLIVDWTAPAAGTVPLRTLTGVGA